MTKKQVERLANGSHELAMAFIVGAGADLVIVSTRIALDLIGLVFGFWLFTKSLSLTGKLGGPRI